MNQVCTELNMVLGTHKVSKRSWLYFSSMSSWILFLQIWSWERSVPHNTPRLLCNESKSAPLWALFSFFIMTGWRQVVSEISMTCAVLILPRKDVSPAMVPHQFLFLPRSTLVPPHVRDGSGFFLTPVAMVLAFLSTRHKKGPHWHLFFTVWPHRTSSWYWERGPGLQLSSPRACRDTEEATLLSIQVQKTTHPLFHLYLMKIFIPYIMSGAIDQNCNLPTVQLWASYLISLCLSDHKCKTGSIRELAS